MYHEVIFALESADLTTLVMNNLLSHYIHEGQAITKPGNFRLKLDCGRCNPSQTWKYTPQVS